MLKNQKTTEKGDNSIMSYPASNKGNRKISVTGIEIMVTVALPEEYEIVQDFICCLLTEQELLQEI